MWCASLLSPWPPAQRAGPRSSSSKGRGLADADALAPGVEGAAGRLPSRPSAWKPYSRLPPSASTPARPPRPPGPGAASARPPPAPWRWTNRRSTPSAPGLPAPAPAARRPSPRGACSASGGAAAVGNAPRRRAAGRPLRHRDGRRRGAQHQPHARRAMALARRATASMKPSACRPSQASRVARLSQAAQSGGPGQVFQPRRRGRWRRAAACLGRSFGRSALRLAARPRARASSPCHARWWRCAPAPPPARSAARVHAAVAAPGAARVPATAATAARHTGQSCPPGVPNTCPAGSCVASRRCASAKRSSRP
jgi:hypothetical protein